MKTSISRKQISLAVACALTLGLASGTVRAQKDLGPNELREVWTDTSKTQIWKNGYGECWHSAFGPPPGYNECNPAPVAQYVAPPPPPAPYVAPAPVQAPYVAPAPAPVVVPAPLPPRKPRG